MGGSPLFSHVNYAGGCLRKLKLDVKGKQVFSSQFNETASVVFWKVRRPQGNFQPQSQTGDEDGEAGAPLGSWSLDSRFLLVPTPQTEDGGSGPLLGRNQLRLAVVAPGGGGQDSEASWGYSNSRALTL